jgi:homoserine kinase type II
MAVFTNLTPAETRELLGAYDLGAAGPLEGIESGIENSNFFFSAGSGRFVLTVFERLPARELPFYLGLMQHLARRGLPVPEPVATRAGALHALVRGKPAAIVRRLPGRSVEAPGPEQCALVGEFLARMHLAARDFALFQPNLRGLGWWKQMLARLEPHMPDDLFQELVEEVIYQDGIVRGSGYEQLPAGPIHADLFRDNVLFEGPAIGGVIDFYFAGCGPWLFDLAVAANDWCVDLASGAFDPARAHALLRAYHALRPLGEDERSLWQPMLRAAALRFWVSRLVDLHLPRPAAMLVPHDPRRFESMLRLRTSQSDVPWI